MFEEKRSFLSPFTTVEGGFVIIVLKVAREEAFFWFDWTRSEG
jgi:hypothetical protein